jgi:galactoside O-acetyltransferase
VHNLNQYNPFDPGYYYTNELRKFGFKQIGENVKIAKNCTIIGLGNISIGDNVRIDGNCVISASFGYLNLGSHIHIGGWVFLGCGSGIVISDFSGLSQRVSIYSCSDDYSGRSLTNPTVPDKFKIIKKGEVYLDRHVIIGAGSVLLPDITINEGSSVGALSLVSKSLDSWGIYIGIPAKKIKNRNKNLLELENLFLEDTNNV